MSGEKVFRLRYVGARFENARMPLDVLPDLPAFRDLLVAYVKAGWKEAHTSRERLPKGFARGLTFILTGIEDGSAIPTISWDTGNIQRHFPEFKEEMELLVDAAYDSITNLISNATTRDGTLETLNSEKIRALSRFGASLQENERIEFPDRSGTDGNIIYLDARRRKQLLIRQSETYKAGFESIGTLLGSFVSEDHVQGHIQVSTIEHGVLSLPVDADQVLADFDGKIGSEVQFRLLLELNRDDQIVKVLEVLEVDLIDAKINAEVGRCRARINLLTTLEDGWLDGHGTAVSASAGRTALQLLKRRPGFAERLRIFPSDGGGMQLEWASGEWRYSMEISDNGAAEICGVEISGQKREMETGVLSVEDDVFWTEFERTTGEAP